MSLCNAYQNTVKLSPCRRWYRSLQVPTFVRNLMPQHQGNWLPGLHTKRHIPWDLSFTVSVMPRETASRLAALRASRTNISAALCTPCESRAWRSCNTAHVTRAAVILDMKVHPSRRNTMKTASHVPNQKRWDSLGHPSSVLKNASPLTVLNWHLLDECSKEVLTNPVQWHFGDQWYCTFTRQRQCWTSLFYRLVRPHACLSNTRKNGLRFTTQKLIWRHNEKHYSWTQKTSTSGSSGFRRNFAWWICNSNTACYVFTLPL